VNVIDVIVSDDPDVVNVVDDMGHRLVIDAYMHCPWRSRSFPLTPRFPKGSIKSQRRWYFERVGRIVCNSSLRTRGGCRMRRKVSLLR
jgi:hypothetical protein